MRINENGDRLDVVFQAKNEYDPPESKGDYGFVIEGLANAEINSLTVRQYGFRIRPLKENKKQGELWILETGIIDTLYYIYDTETETVVKKVENEKIFKAQFVEDFEELCSLKSQETIVSSFGTNYFRNAQAAYVSEKDLNEFLSLQYVDPVFGDKLKLPANDMTGSKEMSVVFNEANFSAPLSNLNIGTTEDAAKEICKQVKFDFVQFKTYKGDLITKHYMAVKLDTSRWELRLLARPPYPFYDNITKIYVLQNDGANKKLLIAKLRTGTLDKNLTLDEIFITGSLYDTPSMPSVYYTLNSILHDSSLSIDSNKIADDYTIDIRLDKFSGSALNILFGSDLIYNDENDYTFQAIFILRTIINLSYHVGTFTDMDTTEDKFVSNILKNVERLKDMINALKLKFPFFSSKKIKKGDEEGYTQYGYEGNLYIVKNTKLTSTDQTLNYQLKIKEIILTPKTFVDAFDNQSKDTYYEEDNDFKENEKRQLTSGLLALYLDTTFEDVADSFENYEMKGLNQNDPGQKYAVFVPSFFDNTYLTYQDKSNLTYSLQFKINGGSKFLLKGETILGRLKPDTTELNSMQSVSTVLELKDSNLEDATILQKQIQTALERENSDQIVVQKIKTNDRTFIIHVTVFSEEGTAEKSLETIINKFYDN